MNTPTPPTIPSDDEVFLDMCQSIDRVVLITHRCWVAQGMRKKEATLLVEELQAAALRARILEGRAVE